MNGSQILLLLQRDARNELANAVASRLTSKNEGNQAAEAPTAPEDEAGDDDVDDKALSSRLRLNDHSWLWRDEDLLRRLLLWGRVVSRGAGRLSIVADRRRRRLPGPRIRSN